MIRSIVKWSLQFRYIVLAIGVSLAYFGVERLKSLPVDVFPEFAPPRVEIQTICLGLSPAEVESLVSVPLENALAGVPGVAVMRSKSVAQLSSIVMIFEKGVDEETLDKALDLHAMARGSKTSESERFMATRPS